MSILTTLAYVRIAATVRPTQIRAATVVAELQAKVDELRREYDETLANVTRQRDEWQNLAMGMMERRETRPYVVQAGQAFAQQNAHRVQARRRTRRTRRCRTASCSVCLVDRLARI